MAKMDFAGQAFKKKADFYTWCDKHNPSHDAVWVADRMNQLAAAGKYKLYDWTRDWAISNGIAYDTAYIDAGLI